MAALGGLVLTSSVADAANTQIVQAAQGQPFASFGAASVRGIYDSTSFNIFDGRQVILVSAGVLQRWVTPVTMRETNETLFARFIGYKSRSGDLLQMRLCSFGEYGNFYSCSSYVNRFVTTSVFVPTDGSAFAQAEMEKTSSSDIIEFTQVKFWQN